jgi:ADP-ribosyl-[dinitrogen reductase] hydrolase
MHKESESHFVLNSFSDSKSKSVAAYLGLAIGDALGATVEFMTANEINHQYGVHRNIIGGGWLRLPAGKVTDDTSMSLALGETIIQTHRINPYDIAHAFSAWLRSKPIDIGNTVRQGIHYFRTTNDPSAPENENAAGNGACMRCLPIAISTLDKPYAEVIQANLYQSHVTHNNHLSDAGTQCIIDMVQLALQGEELSALFSGPVARLINKFIEFDFYSHTVTNPSGYIVDTLQAVFQSLSSTDNFEDCLIDIVNRGGDADTTGAIAGMIAGGLYGVSNIPERWLKKLDPDIALQCESQAKDLYELRKIIHSSDSNPLI